MLDAFEFFIDTGYGFWSPLFWVLAAVVTLLVVAILRGFGKREYKKNTSQTQAFLSGNVEYEKEQMHVGGSNVYWGFLESLKGLYNILNKFHSGIVSDYLLWFVVILAIFFILLGVM